LIHFHKSCNAIKNGTELGTPPVNIFSKQLSALNNAVSIVIVNIFLKIRSYLKGLESANENLPTICGYAPYFFKSEFPFYG